MVRNQEKTTNKRNIGVSLLTVALIWLAVFFVLYLDYNLSLPLLAVIVIAILSLEKKGIIDRAYTAKLCACCFLWYWGVYHRRCYHEVGYFSLVGFAFCCCGNGFAGRFGRRAHAPDQRLLFVIGNYGAAAYFFPGHCEYQSGGWT